MARASAAPEPGSGLLRRAELTYEGAVADPDSYVIEARILLEECRRARDHEAHVVALRAMGWIEHLQVGNHAARERFDQAIRLAERHGLTHRVPELLVSRAAVLHELGRMKAVRNDLDRALSRAEEMPRDAGHPIWCQIALQRAILFHNQGELLEAERLYRAMMTSPACPSDVRVKVGNNLAHLLAMCGRSEEAMPYIDQALDGARALGQGLTAAVAQSRAWILMQTGRLTESLRAFEVAEKLFVEAALPTADFSIEYADALIDLRLLGEASAATDHSVSELSRLGAPLIAAEAQLRRARLSMLLGEFGRARGEIDQAVSMLRRQRRPTWTAAALVTRAELALATTSASPAVLRSVRRAAATLERGGLSGAVEAHLVAGRVANQLGRREQAVQSWRRAAVLARHRSVLIRLRGRVAAALAVEAEDRTREVVRHCRLGLEDLARHRAALPSMELRALASGHGQQLGELGMRALLPDGSPARLFGWLERTRAASLVLVDPPPPDAVRHDLATLRTLHLELREAHRGDGEAVAGVQSRILTLENRIRQASWRASSPSHRAPGAGAVSAAEVRAGLDGAVLVEYALLDEQVMALAVGPRRTRLVHLGSYGPVRTEREALAFGMRRLTQGRRGASALRACGEALDGLRRLLVAPLGIGAEIPVVVVPARGLHGVPWAAMHTAPVSVAQSAGLYLSALEATRGVPSGSSVALVAGPDLPGAIAEVGVLDAVYAATGRDVRTLLPPSSTVDAVTGELATASLVHLSCHGFLRTDNPTFSSLQLADGPLTVHEVAGARGLAPRIVLAACRSGAQMTYSGQEVLGFVSALLARGTAGVVASTVPVPDGESVPMMQALHQRLSRSETFAAALAGARASMGEGADDFAGNPVEFIPWCAYTAYGAA